MQTKLYRFDYKYELEWKLTQRADMNRGRKCTCHGHEIAEPDGELEAVREGCVDESHSQLPGDCQPAAQADGCQYGKGIREPIHGIQRSCRHTA